MVDVTFLGVGAAMPIRSLTNCAYLMHGHGATILFDCGPAIVQQLDAVAVDPSEITHVFVSHRHGDHSLGFPMLILAWAVHAQQRGGVARRPVIVCSDVTWGALEAITLQTFGDPFAAQYLETLPRILLPADKPAQIELAADGGAPIGMKTWPMNHTPFAPVLGARFEFKGAGDKPLVIAFTADTAPDANVIALGRDADLLVHDANISTSINRDFQDGKYGHSSARAAGRHARVSGCKHLALVHLDRQNEGREADYIADARAEFDGRISAPLAGIAYSFE